MPATVLVLVETINDYLPILEHQGFHLILAPTPAERAQAIACLLYTSPSPRD